MTRTTTRITRIIGVAVAGATVGLAATIAVASGGGPDRDPDSYHPAQRAAVADWAGDHRMSGLSPASLEQAVPAADAWAPQRAAEMQAIADYARQQGLSGLSPASLRPTGD